MFVSWYLFGTKANDRTFSRLTLGASSCIIFFNTVVKVIAKKSTFMGSTIAKDSTTEKTKEDIHSSDLVLPHSMLYKIKKKQDDSTANAKIIQET